MNNIELVNKINDALQNVVMSDEIRNLLIELRDDAPSAYSEYQKLEIFMRGMEVFFTVAQFAYEVSQHK